MRMLLDTHSLIWAVQEPGKLGNQAITALQDRENELLLSAATLWEISIKYGLGKLTLTSPYRVWMTQAMRDLSVTLLPITLNVADVLSTLSLHHRDPFDRLLVAQAMIEQVPIVSSDVIFDRYTVSRLW